VELGKGDEVVHPRHGPVFLHDLADHAGRVEAGEAGDVHRRLGMAGADQHAAVAGHQWEDVARRDDVLGPLAGIDRHRNGARPVAGGDSGGDSVARFDGGGEGGFVPGAVVAAHQAEAELLDAAPGQCKADEAAAVPGHEVHGVGRRHLSRDDEIAFILPVLVIDQDEHAAVARLVDQLFRAGKETAGHRVGHQRLSSIIRPI
jgi:hypothetical protein